MSSYLVTRWMGFPTCWTGAVGASLRDVVIAYGVLPNCAAFSLLVSKVFQIRYTIGMTIIDKIYDAVDDFGLITSAEAKELGISNAELVQLAHRGKLKRVAWGVYKMPIWPYQDAAPYALAVKAVGPNARLYGESVIALLELAPTDPSRIWIASPVRVRKKLGEGVRVVHCDEEDPVTYYEGVPSQIVADAIKASVFVLGKGRAVDAAEEAFRRGYLTAQEKEWLVKELSHV